MKDLSDIWKSSFAIFRRVCIGPLFRWRFNGFCPGRVLVSPVDLHFADPELAHEFYHGRFPLAGRVVQVGSLSPFIIEPPSPEWEAALQDFGWLCHMASAGTELSLAYARSLISDWMESSGKRITGNAWRADITARRIIVWISHAEVLLREASSAFQKRFLKTLGLQVRYLRLAVNTMPENDARLQVYIALAFAALSLPVSARSSGKVRRSLARELNRQILPDGGHISRNPAVLLDLLAYLVSLRNCYGESREPTLPALIVALDRMLPALRFFQHRDGSLANFNGVGPILVKRVDIILEAAGETTGHPFSHAPHSGYQRLSFGRTTVIADTGKALYGQLSHKANAGCLSFEMSSGNHRFIVNCGTDPYGPDDFCFLGRLTAAHSTATINDTSSCRFRKANRPGSTIFYGPSQVQVSRIEEESLQGFTAVHDGYRRNFNLLHERCMTLSRSGSILEGADRFLCAQYRSARIKGQNEVTVRFHLHPHVEVRYHGKNNLRLEIPGEYSWLFSACSRMHLEDSIYFSGMSGPQKTSQIVLAFHLSEQNTVKWRFCRSASYRD